MYHAITQHKEPTVMKLICAGENERVNINVSFGLY